MSNRFLQIHTLTSYASSLLNRDDAGFAKRIPFGGVSRTRVSSQCLKRHWRTYSGAHSLTELGEPMSVRSRLTFDRYLRQPLVDEGIEADVAAEVVKALMAEVLGLKAKAEKAPEAEAEPAGDGPPVRVTSDQLTVLGPKELKYLLVEARELAQQVKDAKGVKAAAKKRFDRTRRDNLRALGRAAAGLDAALFGRMVTSDILARGDASVHVAHAFTVHAEAAESDYFSAVDDLVAREGEELGSGHINSSELNSGLYYGYVVVDVPLLVANLEGCKREDWIEADRTLAAGVIERLIRIIATVSPGAKLGSTAPYAYSHLVLVEAGDPQPRTLANAFLRPVAAQPDLVGAAYCQLAEHASQLDRMYGADGTQRRAAAIGPTELLSGLDPEAGSTSVADVAQWAAQHVRGER